MKSLFATSALLLTLSFLGTAQAQPFAYVTNLSANSVSVINTATETVVATIPVGTGPRGVAVDAMGKRVYVANLSSNDVSVIDVATNAVVASVPVGTSPRTIAVNPAGTRVYVPSSSNSVAVIDTMTNTVIATVPVGLAPRGVVVSPDGTRVYVANASNNNVSVIDATNNTAITTIGVGTNPFGVAINPAGTRVYVTNQNTNDVAVIDATNNTFLSGVIVGSVPQGITVNPAGTRAYVTNASGNSVSVIDIASNTVVATITVGTSPVGVGVNPAGTKVYVANGGTNNVSLIDAGTNTVITTVAVGISPGGIAVGPILPPGAPTIGSVAPGNGFASIAFTAPVSNGGATITGYSAKSSPGNIIGTSTGSPVLVSGLTNGTSYTFTVVATNSAGSGPPSAVSAAVVPATVPGAPIIGTATATDSQANVSFSPPANDGGSAITNYQVTTNPATVITGGTSSPILVTSLTNGTTYTFTVKAFNSVGASVASAPSNSVLPAGAPFFPTGVVATPGNASASIAFNAPNANGSAITGYTVTSTPGGIVATGTASPIVVSSLTNGTAYTFQVVATNGVGPGTPSAPSNSVVPGGGVPGAPGSVVASSGNTSATVSFTAAAANGSAITGYTVTASPGTIGATGATSPITVNGLTNGTAYTFKVSATNSFGTGPLSVSSNTVIPGAPDAPTITGASNGNGQVTIGFVPPTANGGSPITGFIVTCNPGGVSATGPSSPIVVTGLTNGTNYSCAVSAVNANGTGPASAPTSIMPVAGAAPVITSPNSASGTIGVPFLYAIVASNSPTSYNASALPVGLTINQANGQISGTPIAASIFTVNIAATNSAGTGTAQLTITISPPQVITAPVVTISPQFINFGSRTVNTSSPFSTVTLTNSGTGNLNISSITGVGDFGFTSTCPVSSAPVAPSGSCAINVTFTPLSATQRQGVISIASNAPGSPHNIQLFGIGTASAVAGISASPSTLVFGTQIVNISSPPQNVVLTNTGFANLLLPTILIDGPFSRVALGASAQPADCAGSVAPESSCQLGIVFTPTAIGVQGGQIAIFNNATELPLIIGLTGSGTPKPIPIIKVSDSLVFGDQILNSASTVKNLTIGNTGAAMLAISAIRLSGNNPDNFSLSGQGACATIAPESSCTLFVTFTPTTTGTKVAQISFTSNADNAASVKATTLTGNGILAPRPLASLATSVIGFGNVIFGGATSNQIVTLTNKGGVAMNILRVDVTGDFFQTNNCGGSLPSLASCTINIIFAPLGTGNLVGEFVLTTNAATSPDRVQLSGTGCRWFNQSKSRLFLTVC